MPNAVWHSALTFVIWHSSFQVGALSPRAHVDARRAAVPIDAARLGRELVRPFTHAAVPPRAVAFRYRGRGLGSLEILHVRIRPAEPENIPCHVVASCESDSKVRARRISADREQPPAPGVYLRRRSPWRETDFAVISREACRFRWRFTSWSC